MRRNGSQLDRKVRLAAAALAATLCLGLVAPASLWAQGQAPAYRVARYEIDIELEPDVHQLRADARLTVVADEPLASLDLYLNRELRVERVLAADGTELPFDQLSRSASFRVDLPRRVSAGDSVQLQVSYLGAFDPAIRPKRGPVVGAITAEGSYLLREARWFPQSANAWERSPMTLTVTVPAGQTALAPGDAEPPAATADGKTRAVFRSEQPTLAGTLVAGQFERVEAAVGAPVAFYLHTVRKTEATANGDTLADIIAFFSDKFGPLANPQLAVVETPDDSWEAYSAPGLLLLPARQWSSSINPRLLARYLAQQWWGGQTSPATESDVFLSDALARYSEALYVEHTSGEEGLRGALEDLTVGALVNESASSIANAERLSPYSPEYNAVVRDKGAMVLHMLRQVIGDEAFFQLLQDYARRFARRGATLDEFELLAEEISDQPLDYFFGQWIRSTGVPQFDTEYVIYRTQEGFRVAGELKHDLEIFRMAIPVRVETEGPPVTELVQAAGPSSPFSIETFGKPLRIEIDPDYNVLKYTSDLRLRVAIARGESLFQRGAYFEATREYNQALEVKRNSSLAHYRMGEAFFAQRNYQAAANSFREAISGDQQPKWTVVWSHIFLGKVFDLTGQRERAINEYRRALDTNDDTQGAQAEARKYLQEPYRRERRTIQTISRP
jgi:hypothetical protein